MNKTVFKIFTGFTLTAAIIAMVLLLINFLGFGLIASDDANIYEDSPAKTLNELADNLVVSKNHYSLEDSSILPSDYWCILLDENGDIIWSQNQPDDIPLHYSINDIAKITRWYLNDYPVYVRTEDYGLLILGIPKNAVGKYSIDYSMRWFDLLPQKILVIFSINLILAIFLAVIFGAGLYKRLTQITRGIKDLHREKLVHLPERGIFKELCRNVNEISSAVSRKNAALAARETARSNWIAGISHDIRTPLAVVMGNAEALETSGELFEQNQQRVAAITTQAIKIKNLIDDLNLISSLEYDMQPLKKQPIRLASLLRTITTDFLNSGLSDNYPITLEIAHENAIVLGDKILLERAICNLINNSIYHNKNGCQISIREYRKQSVVYIEISDTGTGVEQAVLDSIKEIPKTAHGLGLPMAYKIIGVHNGRFFTKNNHGFLVTIELPLMDS